MRIILGVVFLLHGLVHALYFGHSARLFELQPGLAWPDGSWLFARAFGHGVVRVLASVSCVLAALGFIAGGIGVFASQAWWRPAVAGSAAFSAVLFILFWDGRWRALPNQGWIGIFIDLAILATVAVFRWPR